MPSMASVAAAAAAAVTPAVAEESVALAGAQLLRVDVQAALDADFVRDNTREPVAHAPATTANASSASREREDGGRGGSDKEAAADEGAGSGWASLRLSDPASSLSSLLSTVQSESQTEHLTAGLRHTVSADEGQDVLARLARQMASLGLAADHAYQTLSYKRTIIIQRLNDVRTYSSSHQMQQFAPNACTACAKRLLVLQLAHPFSSV
jgi:hypothetical protein